MIHLKMNDRIPPADIESEVALLGSVLIDPTILDNVMGTMKPEYFYKEIHQIIFRVMVENYHKQIPLDYISLMNGLKAIDKIETVGGATYITSLTKEVASGSNYGYYTMSVIDSFVRREYIALSYRVTEQCFSNGSDIADIMSEVNRDILEIQKIFSGIQKARQVGELVDEAFEDYFERKKLRESGQYIGIPTGINALTKLTGGWQKGDSIILAGRTSMGKTALALHFAAACFNAGKKVQFFSYEMTAIKLADRVLIGQSKINTNAYRYGNLTVEDEQKAEETIERLRLVGCYIDDNSNQNIDQVIAKCRIAKSKGLCDLAVIDYLGLIPSERKDIREQEVASISAKVKKAAKELDIPFITLVQVNRGVEMSTNKRPKLSDLRESGAIEQDADLVIFAYRPEYYGILQIDVSISETIDSEGMGIAIVAKQRNGPIGDIMFQHSHGMNVIQDFQKEGEIEFTKPF